MEIFTEVERRARTLSELLLLGRHASSPTAGEVDEARVLVTRWRRLCAAGNEEHFRRRLAFDGWPAGEELVACLARGLAFRPAVPPPWCQRLAAALPPGTTLADMPARLADHAGRELALRCPPWARLPAPVRDALVLELRRHLRDLVVQVVGDAGEEEARRGVLRMPFLARLAAQRAEQWVESTGRLAVRLARDRRVLRLHLAGGAPLGRVVEVTAGLSDRHDGGATVVHLRWRGGFEAYYKPRPLAGEAALATWCHAFAAAGLDSLPAPPPLLQRQGYGWMAAVRQASLAHRQEVAGWFRAAGSLAAVAWLLGYSDLHTENVVAGRDGPVIVDGETLARPVTVLDPARARQGEDSILATGFVTFPFAGVGGVRELGALLGGTEGGAASLPRFCGVPAQPRGYVGEVVAGCRAALEVALAQRQRWLSPVGPLAAMRGVRGRWVPRPSDAYARLFSSLLSPAGLASGINVSLLAEALLRPLLPFLAARPAWWPLVGLERESLERFEVPRFEIPVEGVPGLVERCGRDGIRERLRRLDEKEIERQCALLATALTPPRPRGGEDPLLRLGHRLLGAVSTDPVPEGNHTLGRGTLGVAVSLAAWGRVTGSRLAVRRCRELLSAALVHVVRGEGLGPPNALGLCTGLGGAIYALTVASRLLDERQWLAAAVEAACGVPPRRMSRAVPLDVEGGVAGFVLALAAVHALAPEAEVQARLRWATARLAEGVDAALRRRRHLAEAGGGFAHGASGLAAALLAAHSVLGEPSLLDQAARCLAGESGAGHWQGQAAIGASSSVPVLVQGWCHGPPGAFLARCLAHPRLRAPWLVRQREGALHLSRAASLGGALHLCCGSIGVSEILLTGGLLLAREALVAEARERTEALVRSHGEALVAMRGGGLFFGAAGALLHLARCRGPHEVGSVLAAQVGGGASPWS